MTVNYILTTFSPAMFGSGATAHIRIVDRVEAEKYVSSTTRVVATRPSHERLARKEFPNTSEEAARYAMLKPGVSALHMHYRGPQVPDSGEMPVGGMITYYLVEVEEYQEHEA